MYKKSLSIFRRQTKGTEPEQSNYILKPKTNDCPTTEAKTAAPKIETAIQHPTLEVGQLQNKIQQEYNTFIAPLS